MADQLRWWKLWTASLTDPDLERLSLEDWARWARLGALTTTHGDHGTYHAKHPARALVNTLRIGGHQGYSRYGAAWCWKTTLDVLRRLPGIVVTVHGESTSAELTIVWKNWRKYQEDSSAKRMREWRERRRRSDGQQTVTRDDSHTVTSDATPSSHVTVQTRREEKNTPLPPVGGSSPTGPLARWSRAHGPLSQLHPDDRQKLARAAPSWPPDQLPPDPVRLWFHNGAWHRAP